MKATFKGVPGEKLDSIHMYGQDYPLGKSVKVTGALAMKKLANHPHFTATFEPSDDLQDAQIKREFAGAAEAVLKPIEEAHVPEPSPAPTPAPTEAPQEPVKSALEWQERYEKGQGAAGGVAMPDVVHSAAEYQDLEMKGATNGNARKPVDPSLGETQDPGPGRDGNRIGPRKGK